MNDIKSKKLLCYLQTCSLSISIVHSVWKKIETVKQVKRCIITARNLTGTYTLMAHHNVFNRTMDPTCPHCQLGPEDLQHMVSCPGPEVIKLLPFYHNSCYLLSAIFNP